MQVIGIGLLRTGTTSLALALDRLGYGPCYNMRVLNAEPERAADWAAAMDGRTVDWGKVFAGFGCAVGSPSTAFWREIVDAFPDAKVVLTVRDPQRWYDSAAQTMAAVLAKPPLLVRMLSWRGPRRPDPEAEVLDRVQRTTWHLEIGGPFGERAEMAERFERHVAEVKAYVPEDRLLVFEVKKGWEPLCAFLGVPVPDEPFPRENDAATFKRRQRQALKKTLAPRILATLATTALATGAAVTWALHRKRHPTQNR
ncbi:MULTISPECIES: sulfotransferase family protein [unclassified Actinomadura]|uniref:sulfotransferase family protein n=1 Tax=unclassified Actinomadura TaxID=2626254 RepID=UPI0011EDE92C|nr:sulfotransferase family protein [Actinomadura sp. K4S16]